MYADDSPIPPMLVPRFVCETCGERYWSRCLTCNSPREVQLTLWRD